MSDSNSETARDVLDRVAAAMLKMSIIERFVISMAAIILALFVGLLVVATTGYNPAAFSQNMLEGAFGSEAAIAQTLMFTTLFILTGVSVSIAFRAGVFNIGVQGQFIVGGFATVLSILWTAPLLPEGTIGGVILIIVGTLAAIVAGGAYAAVPGILKAYGGANEIVTTIMLNFIAIGTVGWLVEGPFRGEGQSAPNTERLPEYAELPQLIYNSPSFSVVGLGVAFLIAAIIAILMSRTSFGYDIITSGHQESAAAYSGVNAKRMVVITMTVSGMVAGIAGAIFTIMIQGYYSDPAGIGSYGYDAIAVSLLAANHPLGVIPAGLLFGSLDSAGSYIGLSSDVPAELINGTVGLVVLFIAAPELFRMAAKRTGLGGDEQ
ncbi:ABC transporter permease [Haladaptatus pallidirubidus]|uniref:ABC transporter permease n=1 Tax=Haladaptatus pallidirubidus TaxID=1008152 RepID=A0AAV3UJ32_9EURY|nr:ABC transporter permease [Haladaptatus pallidirubidus]